MREQRAKSGKSGLSVRGLWVIITQTGVYTKAMAASSSKNKELPKKQPYRSPTLTVYGSVKKITQMSKTRRVKDTPGPKKT